MVPYIGIKHISCTNLNSCLIKKACLKICVERSEGGLKNAVANVRRVIKIIETGDKGNSNSVERTI